MNYSRSEIRQIYNEACYGAGAEPRNVARCRLEAFAASRKQMLFELFEEFNLDLNHYFASCPIA